MKKLAIVGASGLVGQEVFKVLKEENLLNEFEITMFVSDKTAGKVMVDGDKHYTFLALNNDAFCSRFDYAIFLTSEEISRVWIPRFASYGVRVIDNSSAFRLHKEVPLVVPEINFDKIMDDLIIANPNCSTIQLVIVLDRLMKLSRIKRVVVSSYQSVSGAGKDALLDLERETRQVFKQGIKDNIIPQIGGLLPNYDCTEEYKIIHETQKILDSNFEVFATTARVPISYCHGESVFVEFENPVKIDDVKDILDVDYIKVGEENFAFTQCRFSNLTFVCRLRQSKENIVQMFIIADNLRRGAAYNAVEILKRLLLRGK